MVDPNSGDTSFMAISSALVLLMTPGLGFYYGGMVRETNILNTMMMSLISMGIVSFLWLAFGFSMAFTWTTEYAGLHHLSDMNWPGTQISGLLFATYQMTFAIITAAIISGALVERIRFMAYVIFISIWLAIVYVPLCNWVWGGGWIAQLGAKDFAGGTVVHISSGTAAYVTASLLGHRKRAVSSPHNVPFVVLGGSLLWFGWTGFNGGSALASNDLAGLAIANTFIAAALGMVGWTVTEFLVDGHASALGAVTGVVAGLVGITPIAGFVSPLGSSGVGVITAVVCFFAVKTLNQRSFVDDSLDCFAVHSVGGYTGAILGGFFDKVDGLLYGANGNLLFAQFIGASSGMIFSAVGSALIFIVLQRFMRVRVLDHEEDDLDHYTHKEVAYKSEAAYMDSMQSRIISTQLATLPISQDRRPKGNGHINLLGDLFCCAFHDVDGGQIVSSRRDEHTAFLPQGATVVTASA
jgi:ammonium transporter, Amt family